jgi:hypothetical protein
MKVQLLTINTTETPRVFRVALLVGSQPLRFNVTVEIDTLANQTILITHGSQEFSEFFRFNQDLASKISKFVCSFSESIPIHFPIYIGDFLPFGTSYYLLYFRN